MRKTVLLTAFGLISAVSAHSQTVLADWTFESSGLGSSTPSYAPGAGNASTNFYAEAGTQAGSAYAIGEHTGAAVYTSSAGNGSAKSLSSTVWTAGDYYQFQVSTTGYTLTTVSFDQISSGTGPGDFQLYYSTDDSTFTAISGTTYTVPNSSSIGTWSASTAHTGSSFSFDLTSLGLTDDTTVYLRLQNIDTVSAAGGTTATTGTDRIDNVVVNGESLVATPEPSVVALLAAGGVAVFGSVRRQKK